MNFLRLEEAHAAVGFEKQGELARKALLENNAKIEKIMADTSLSAEDREKAVNKAYGAMPDTQRQLGEAARAYKFRDPEMYAKVKGMTDEEV